MEYFTDYDKICCDISDEISVVELERDKEREKQKLRELNLFSTEEEVRTTSMNRGKRRDMEVDHEDIESKTALSKNTSCRITMV